MYADVCYAYAGSLPKLLPAEGRLPERGFSRKIEAECERIRRLLLEQVEEFMPHGSPWENSMREPEGQYIRQHTLAYVSIRTACVNPKARRCSPSLTLAMRLLDVC